MKPLKERFLSKYLRNKQRLELQENIVQEYFFKVNFYNIPVQERFIIDDNFIIISSAAEIPNPITVPVLLKDGVFKVQFELEGYSFYSDQSSNIEIKEGYFNLFYIPSVNGKLHYKKNRKCIDIMFDKTWFEQYVLEKFPAYTNFIDQLKQDKAVMMFPKAAPIRADIKHLLHSLLNCNLHPDLKPSFYKIKIEELLLLILSFTDEHQEQSLLPTSSLSIDEKVVLIKEWINKQEIGNIRLQEIEEKFKVTQKTLNKGFHKYYGCSISQYMRKLQMEKASSLIKDGGYSINEVSKLLRYSYPQHFTTAFTKYFGYPPKELKKH